MSNLADIERQCKMLMTAHGVGSLTFEWDNHKKRIGACHHTTVNGVVIPFKITVSKHYARVLTMDEIREVMLHEIAHALTPGHGHGPKWKNQALQFGITPKPRVTMSARPEAIWKGYCVTCGNLTAEYHRAPLKATWACAAKTCVNLPALERLLVWHKNGRLMPAQDISGRYYDDWIRIQTKYNPRFKENK